MPSLARDQPDAPFVGGLCCPPVVGDAIGAAFVPGDAPEPVAFVEHALRGGPVPAILGEGDARLAFLEDFALIDGAAHDEHEAAVGREGELRVAQVNAVLGEQGGGVPLLAVGGGQDADVAVAADVALGFAEGAEPLVAEAGEVGEGVVRRGVPDLLDGDAVAGRRRGTRRGEENHRWTQIDTDKTGRSEDGGWRMEDEREQLRIEH